MNKELITAICIAGGRSLTREDVEYCQGKGKVYAVKEAALLAPWADIMYAADGDWWDNNPERWESFAGEKWTCSEEAATRHGLNYIPVKSQWHWSLEKGVIASGGNSGFQVLNMAELDGAERIIMLGYDYGYEPGQDKHWFDTIHPRHSRQSNYKEWNERLRKATQYVRASLINCTPVTNIDCIARANLRDIL